MNYIDPRWKLKRAIEQRRLLIQEQVEKEATISWARSDLPTTIPEVPYKKPLVRHQIIRFTYSLIKI